MATPREAFVTSMTSLFEEDERVALVLADISVSIFEETTRRIPARVVNVGIREQALIGVTAGLALSGMRPVAHTYAPFLVERPFEQVKLDLGHQGLGAVLVSVGASYDASSAGRTHQCPADVALLDTLDGWTVHVPGHAAEVDGLLRSAVAGEGKAYVRLSESVNTAPSPGPVVRRGPAGAPLVVAVGPLLDNVLAATDGLPVSVCHLTTVRPFPDQLIAELAETDVVLVEPYLAGTSSNHVLRALADRPVRITALGVQDVELHRFGSPADHDRAHGLDPAGIRARLSRALQVSGNPLR